MRIFLIALFVIGLDQATKWLVLQTMHRHQSIPLLGDWLRFTFTENPGMAFGIEVGPPGTVALLALAATGLVIFYLIRVRHGYWPYRASLALILGGAIGNIIDRVFYGVWLGYGEWFTGRVVDFIHVSLWQGFVPSSVPFIGGRYMELFPIWNVADMAIVLGVVGVLVFHNTFYEDMIAKENGEVPAKEGASTDTPGDSASETTNSSAGTNEQRSASPVHDDPSTPDDASSVSPRA